MVSFSADSELNLNFTIDTSSITLSLTLTFSSAEPLGVLDEDTPLAVLDLDRSKIIMKP